MTERFAARAAAYYTDKLSVYGATHRGVDWNSVESQELRFEQLLRLCDNGVPIAINDFGCGYGALVDYLVKTDRRFDYLGYDAAPAMIESARRRLAGVAGCAFTADRSELVPRDYTIASGVFNVKLDIGAKDWWAYVARELDGIAGVSRRGFAFNMLTAYSDPARKREDLFYAEPEAVFAHCMSRFSRSVALRHDYGLFEFTVLVRV